MKAEIARRQSNTEKVIVFFRAHEGVWIDATAPEAFSRFAWRTRVSNAREIFCEEQGLCFPVPRGSALDSIENRTFTLDGRIVSEYRYRSNVMGRDADTFIRGDVRTGTLFPPAHPSGWQEQR